MVWEMTAGNRRGEKKRWGSKKEKVEKQNGLLE